MAAVPVIKDVFDLIHTYVCMNVRTFTTYMVSTQDTVGHSDS